MMVVLLLESLLKHLILSILYRFQHGLSIPSVFLNGLFVSVDDAAQLSST